MLRRLARCTRGATAVEYGLLLAFIAMAMFAGVMTLSSAISGTWSDIADHVTNAQ